MGYLYFRYELIKLYGLRFVSNTLFVLHGLHLFTMHLCLSLVACDRTALPHRL